MVLKKRGKQRQEDEVERPKIRSRQMDSYMGLTGPKFVFLEPNVK